MTSRPLLRAAERIAPLIVVFGLASVSTAQDSESMKEELGGLQEDVKAAVIAELIPREDAKSFYRTLAELTVATSRFADTSDKDTDVKLEDARARGGMTYTQFEIDIEAQTPETLLTPEFARRDLGVISDSMGGAETNADVAEALIEDYLTAFDTMRREVVEDLEIIRATRRMEAATQLLQRIQDRRIDWPRVDEKVDAWYSGGEDDKGGEAARRKTMQWLEDRVVRLGTTIERYEGLVATQRARLAERERNRPDREASSILAEAREIRRSLRERLEEGLLAIEGARSTEGITIALDRLRIAHGRNLLRFSGSDYDPTQVLAALGLDADLERRCLDSTASLIPRIARLVDERNRIAIAREIRSVELAENADDPARRTQLRNRVVDDFQRELQLDLRIRGTIQDLQDAIAGVLAVEDEGLATEFRHACRAAAFPSQMRERWSERAIAAALALPGIDDATLTALLELEAASSDALADLRTMAVDTRLRNEPLIADAMLQMLRGEESEIKDLGDITWRESRHEDFDRFEEQRAAMLLAILGTERFDQLPPRPKRWSFGDKTADKRAGTGKTRPRQGKGQSQGKGQGRGGGK